jgi:glucosamine--fructose-6-phosphate aminotransferase (isomerizing)
MCGIVGYLGPLNPKDVILNGLKKLEYRGYDSAGVAILHQGKTKRVRAEGKLLNLEEKLKTENFDGHLGIGHTRWATHGVPNETNAHPHQVGSISIVHNGIIENYLEIREQLLKRGAQIKSETDSELVAHLISEQYLQSKNLKDSVFKVLPMLKGAFSVLVICEAQPDELIAFKDGPPLIVGVGKDQTFIVSDVQAALQFTKEFIYLEDREVVCIKNNKFEFFSTDRKPITKKPTIINWDIEQTEKKGFAHFMLKEIFEQPQAFSSAIAEHIDHSADSIKLANCDLRGSVENIDRITLIACGTSNYACMVGKYLIERLAQIPCEVDFSSEFRYRQPLLNKNSFVITVSQSGETADTLAGIRLAKSKGVKTLSICNVKNSTIDREADFHLYMNSGPEIGVASTKAFVSTLGVLNCLALQIAILRKTVSEKTVSEHVDALVKTPSLLERVLSYDKYFLQATESLRKFKGFLYLGRGVSFPISLEGALKMKELAYVHAEGYAAGEMKHGPLALIDDKMAIVTVIPHDEHFEKTLSNLEEAKARGGKIIAIGTGDNPKVEKISDRYIGLPAAHWSVNPILAVVPLQLMAYHLARGMGNDVDQPRNLAKSVTVE